MQLDIKNKNIKRKIKKLILLISEIFDDEFGCIRLYENNKLIIITILRAHGHIKEEIKLINGTGEMHTIKIFFYYSN